MEVLKDGNGVVPGAGGSKFCVTFVEVWSLDYGGAVTVVRSGGD